MCKVFNKFKGEVKMTVEELIKMLKKYPKDMQIINSRYSDYELIEEDEWSIVEAVPDPAGWLMRSHPTMSDENKANAKRYLHLQGN